ncbi:NKG2-D type II integral membrane protein-like [Erythrolamprus reginae]|uniref:NKG2-D type II integral membrane protein-like n=1 Tax=Erythrolamprus reginae TaxID=121349 RepID=UPI00396CAEC6
MAGGIPDEEGHLSNGYDPPRNGYDPVQKEEIEMPNKDEEHEQQQQHPNGNARGQEENPESRCKYRKRPCIAILLAIICILLITNFIFVALFVSSTMENQKCQALQTGTPGTPLNIQKDATECTSDWHVYQGFCYKLSKEEKDWLDSRDDCLSHNASLAKVTEEERDTMRMFTRDSVYWIGLKRDAPNQPWQWLDGENATIKIIGNGGDCAFLDSDVKGNAVRCTSRHHYMCKKNAPKGS